MLPHANLVNLTLSANCGILPRDIWRLSQSRMVQSINKRSNTLFDTNVIFDTNALFDSGCIQFGTFTLRSDLTSPISMDLRRLMSHPRLLRQVARAMAGTSRALTFDCIAAAPHASLPVGVALALEMGLPLIQPSRATNKAYSTHHNIEGTFEPGETALLIDDLIIRGDSKLATIATLEAAGLTVHDVLVLIDWEQGGAENLAQRGYDLHAVLQLTKALDVLRESARITPTQHAEILRYLRPDTN